ncbi:MAG: LL-diaminopimelate aminotransferase [Chloroflexi bacterium]|nr:MAG: LL-diaminopimelate aminotransferase [Chloroflexota bacterium]
MKLSSLLQQLPPYHFAEYNRMMAEKQAAGVDVINFSMGDPDLPTPAPVLEALTEAAYQPSNQRYPEYAGMPQLREAVVEWFQRRFGVGLDADAEVLPLIGSKEGLAHLPLAVMDRGDTALVPDPGYPVYPTAVTLAGGIVVSVPLSQEEGWLPDLTAIPADVADRAKVLWLNYPNNPTGACAPLTFFEAAVRFAKRHDILLVHDMAYAEVAFDGYRPHSILEVAGARDVAVEFHSLSKAFNMAGFRVGMLLGNRLIVQGLARLKSHLDTGIFRPIQVASSRALALPQEWLAARNAVYQRRRDRLGEALRHAGMQAEVPKAGLYIWARIPAGYVTSSQFVLDLLDQTGVALTPGTNFGVRGEGYIRMSLTVPDAQIETAIARLESAKVGI